MKTIFILLCLVLVAYPYEKDGHILTLFNEDIDEAIAEFDHLFIKFHINYLIMMIYYYQSHHYFVIL